MRHIFHVSGAHLLCSVNIHVSQTHCIVKERRIKSNNANLRVQKYYSRANIISKRQKINIVTTVKVIFCDDA